MTPAAAIVGLVADAELPASLASELIRAGVSLDQASARVATALRERLALQDRASDIRGICRLAHCAGLADGYIASTMTLDAIKAHLCTLTAIADRVDIDSAIDVPRDRPRAAAVSTAAIYRERNAAANAARGTR